MVAGTSPPPPNHHPDPEKHQQKRIDGCYRQIVVQADVAEEAERVFYSLEA